MTTENIIVFTVGRWEVEISGNLASIGIGSREAIKDFALNKFDNTLRNIIDTQGDIIEEASREAPDNETLAAINELVNSYEESIAQYDEVQNLLSGIAGVEMAAVIIAQAELDNFGVFANEVMDVEGIPYDVMQYAVEAAVTKWMRLGPEAWRVGDASDLDIELLRVLDALGYITEGGDFDPTPPPVLNPIVLDLNNDGSFISDDALYVDISGDSYLQAMYGLAQGDGLLIYDGFADGSTLAGNGLIDHVSEYSFSSWMDITVTDAQALAMAVDLNGDRVFDTNGDGYISADDTSWSTFGVFIDSNGNSLSDPGEILALDDLGITSIDLNTDETLSPDYAVIFQSENGGIIYGETIATVSDPVENIAIGDVGLQYEEIGMRAEWIENGFSYSLSSGNEYNIWVSVQDDDQAVSLDEGLEFNVFFSDGAPSTIDGRSATDNIAAYSVGGEDTILAGAGDDAIVLLTNEALVGGLVRGGDGNDLLFIGDAGSGLTLDLTELEVEALILGEGVVSISASDDRVDYFLESAAYIEEFTSADGNDYLVLSTGGNTISLGAGDDFLHIAGNAESIATGEGYDLISLTEGVSSTIVDFDPFRDALTFGYGVVSPFTSDPDLEIVETNGSVVVSSGGATVTLLGLSIPDWQDGYYHSFQGAVNGTADGDIIDSGYTDLDGDYIDGTSTTVFGADGNDLIYDSSGNDVILGGSGNDRMFGGLGADFYDGGAGNADEVRYDADVGIVVDMLNSAISTGIAAGDQYVDIERVRTSQFDDIIILADDIFLTDARGGNDDITDAMGREVMRGGAGADIFHLLSGDGERDVILDFTIGLDVIDISAWGVSDFADLSFTQDGAAAIVSYGTESLELTNLGAQIDSFTGSDFGLAGSSTQYGAVDGTSAADVIDFAYVDGEGDSLSDLGQDIYGGFGNDFIYSGAGADRVFGGDGNDRMFASLGADTYDGGNGNADEVRFDATVGIVLDMTNAANSTDIAAGDTFINIERVRTGQLNDVIVLANDIFLTDARGGDDDITDAMGREIMRGGSGADTFRFLAGDGEQDRILDFVIGTDTIDITSWGVGSFGDLSFTASGTAAIVAFGSERIELDGLAGNLSDFTASDFDL